MILHSNKFRHRLAKCIKYFVNALFIKNRRKLFFESFPDCSDNSRAFSDYLRFNGFTPKYKILWAVNSIPAKKIEGVHYVLKKDRFSYFYHTVTSYFLFSTHGAFNWCNPHLQRYVCFWHGTMLKRICQMQNPDDFFFLEQAWRFISPSEYYIDLYAQSFGRKRQDILLIGYPRCDLLFNSNDSFERLGIKIHDKTKVVVYMPTFRQPVSGAYKDSSKNVFEEDFIKFSDSANIDKWNSFFEERNILLIVKPHPSDKNVVKCDHCSSILVITNDNLQNNDIQLYSLLASADALITDYSSVYCDYLLLDRPIGFVVTDIEEYSQGRGFVFDNPLEFMPGYIISTETEFKCFFDDLYKGIDITKEKRNRLQFTFNKYHDGRNCERIADSIGLRK